MRLGEELGVVMEISAISSSSQGGSVQAQVSLQKKAGDQQEQVVSTIMQGTEESAAKVEATGKSTLAVA